VPTFRISYQSFRASLDFAKRFKAIKNSQIPLASQKIQEWDIRLFEMDSNTVLTERIACKVPGLDDFFVFK
jgi:hypothetical protein